MGRHLRLARCGRSGDVNNMQMMMMMIVMGLEWGCNKVFCILALKGPDYRVDWMTVNDKCE